MKKILCSIFVLLLSSQPSFGGGLFDADEWGNFFSGGTVGRERDKERAVRDRLLALERELAAERLKQEKMESLFKQNSVIGASLESDRQILKSLELMTQLVGSQKTFMLLVVELLHNAGVAYEGITRLVSLQQSDLKLFVDYGLDANPGDANLIALQSKIEMLELQIENFPEVEMNGEEFNTLLDNALNNSNETILLIDSTVTSLKKEIKRQEDEIAANERRLQELKKKPKPKKRIGNLGRCYPKAGGGMKCGYLEP